LLALACFLAYRFIGVMVISFVEAFFLPFGHIWR
jgi:hypothetical protein